MRSGIVRIVVVRIVVVRMSVCSYKLRHLTFPFFDNRYIIDFDKRFVRYDIAAIQM